MSDDGRPPKSFWVETGPSKEFDVAGLDRNPSVYGMSRESMYQACVNEVLVRDLGFTASAQARRGVLGDGRPIPLMSYAFVEYVMGLDIRTLDVLELGSGNSTFFWAERTNSVLTVDHGQEWIDQIQGGKPANVQIARTVAGGYVQFIKELERSFDIIVVDCSDNRLACAKAIEGRLREGGLVVLDNSDWYPNAASALRDQGLIQIDFPDFRPDHYYRCSTSMFLHPQFRPKPVGARLPLAVLGGKDLANDNIWDKPLPG